MPTPHATTTGELSPFVPTLTEGVERAIRAVLSLRPNVRVELLGCSGGPVAPPDVAFRLHLPDRGRLDLGLSHPESARSPWRRGRYAGLSYRADAAGVDPTADPSLARSLLAATEARDGERPAAALWAAVAELGRYDGISDYMYRQLSAGTMGPTAYLRLGFRCNQDCGFCWQGRDWPDAGEAAYRGWLDEIAAAGVRHLSITGGEPTLHPALPDLIERATAVHHMAVMLQTNAIRLRKPAFLQRLRDAGLRVLFVSFHAADPAVSDAMTGAPGTHAGTVAGIEAALGAGMVVVLNCVVEAANAAALEDHARFVVDRFVTPFPQNPVRSVSYSNPAAYFDRDRWLGAMPPFDVIQGPLLAAARVLRQAGVLAETMGTCGFPPCLFHDEPALIRLVSAEDLERMDERDRVSRAHGAICQGCAALARCQGPRSAYLERYGDRGLRPFEVLPDAPGYVFDTLLAEQVFGERPLAG